MGRVEKNQNVIYCVFSAWWSIERKKYSHTVIVKCYSILVFIHINHTFTYHCQQCQYYLKVDTILLQANFIDDPVEIYTYMFDQNIGCGLTMLYEEWANFLERLGNTKKADTIYLEGIARGAQPLDALRLKHRFVPKLYVCVCGLMISSEECFQPQWVSWQHKETGQHLTGTLEGVTRGDSAPWCPQIETQVCVFLITLSFFCGLGILFGECASFLEYLGNIKKADTIQLEGIAQDVWPLAAFRILRLKHKFVLKLYVWGGGGGCLFVLGWGGGGGLKTVDCTVD